MRRRFAHLSLLSRFSVLSLLALAALGAVIGAVLAQRIERRAMSDAQRLAVVMARTGAESALRPSDLRGPVSRARAAQLDRSLLRPLAGSGAAIVKIYNRDGTTKTYFKPGSPDYFDRQPGRPVKLNRATPQL